MCVCVFVCMCVHIYIYMCVCVCIHMCAYIHILQYDQLPSQSHYNQSDDLRDGHVIGCFIACLLTLYVLCGVW